MKARSLAGVALSLALVTATRAATNSWTDGSSKWEMSTNWSLGVAPGTNGQSLILITNVGNNTVTIDAFTTNTPGTMVISNLTLGANKLSLNNAGSNVPLRILDRLVLTNNASLLISNSALQVGGPLQIDTSTASFSSGTTVLSSNLLIGTSGTATSVVDILSGTTLVATNGTIGIGNNGTVTGGGGRARMTVGSNGTLLATTIYLGNSTNNQSDLIIAAGGTVQSSGSTSCLFVDNSLGTELLGNWDWHNGSLQVADTGPSDYDIAVGAMFAAVDVFVGYSDTGTLTMEGGVANISSRLIVGYLGSPVVSTGTVSITGGQVAVSGDTYIGNDGVGQMNISGSAVMAATDVIVANSSNPGTLTVAGGIMNVYDSLTVGDCGAGHVGAVAVTGGFLFVTNAAHNGTLTVRNGTLTLNSGQLKVDQFVMTDSCASFVRNGGTLIYGSATLDPARDDDGDGIPNGYEQAHGLDPLNAVDARLDNDGDGFSNLQEYQAGTNPNDANDTPFRITAVARENNNVRITWRTVAGTTNALQVTSGISGNFNSSGFADSFTVNPVVGTTTNYLDIGGATSGSTRYYRVRLVP